MVSYNCALDMSLPPKSDQLDLVSSTASSNGIVELQYRRTR